LFPAPRFALVAIEEKALQRDARRPRLEPPVAEDALRPHRRDHTRADERAAAAVRPRQQRNERALRSEATEPGLLRGSPRDQPTEHQRDALPSVHPERTERR